jgi:hypothetical protein
LIFLFLWRMLLEFWWGFYWICRLLLVVWPFQHYLLCRPMNMEVFPYFSVNYNIFLSPNNFHYNNIYHLWWSLCLSTFRLFWMGLIQSSINS